MCEDVRDTAGRDDGRDEGRRDEGEEDIVGKW